MEYLTAKQAADVTGLSERTIRRMIERGDLPARHANRRRYAIATKDLPPHKPSPTGELLARVEALERAVQRLTYAVEALTGARTLPPVTQPSESPLTASGGHSDAPPGVPAGARRMKEITDLHGISHATAKRAIQQGIVAAFTRPQPGRPGYVEYWLTPEQIAPALRIWQSRGVMFSPCPDCPHE
jgi:excisionase family DNA binding protein